ncbi:hypothetical protein [Phycicoccus sp. Soil748]|uniref:hypothetical protein n=1 Tax=Phycicoccus sp. Soil748 TaxID=1736397 RepID=UPI0007023F6B|nr:hypothetical protein [Phycicoccus sp. Soil748]KRE56221.1 hypothetical protein ASG70_03445 [Phycicoccus sp. Soil748]
MYPVEATIRLRAESRAGTVDASTASLLGLAGTGAVEHVSVLATDPRLLRAVLFVRAERALGAEQAARVALWQWCREVGGAELLECSVVLGAAPRTTPGRA